MYSLLPYNTFGIDVSANRFIEYASVEELKTLIEQGAVTTPFLHIGGGSNLLFTKDYEGVVLHSRIEGIEVAEEDERSVSVRVGAGVVWDDFVAYCVEHGWYGAENLSLINGEVGASAVQNIGAYGVEGKDLEGIVSQLRLTAGVEVAIFIYEMETQLFKVSLRSNGKVDVSRIAVFFGGGGHVRAAGCDMQGSMYDVINNLTAEIEKQLAEE